MSSKSAHKRSQQKNPYNADASRGRGRMLLVTVIVLVLAAGTWLTSYTSGLSKGTANPNAGEVAPAGPIPATDTAAPATK